MHLKHSYIILYLLWLYCDIGENADAPQNVPEDSSQRSAEQGENADAPQNVPEDSSQRSAEQGENADAPQNVPENRSPRPAERACQEIMRNYRSSAGNYIVNGDKAVQGEFPYMVSVVNEIPKARIYCGGALISSNFVLTAAHCLDKSVPGDRVIVRVGSLGLANTQFNPDTDIIVAQRYPYPTRKRGSLNDDISILKLKKHVNITKNIRPICLDTNEADPKEQLVITGWGKTSQNGQLSPVLLKAYVKAVPQAKCDSFYNRNKNRRNSVITKKQLCVMDPRHKQDTCQGDSGSPLVIPAKDGGSKVAGVDSYGIDCSGTKPKVFTRVSSYLSWIEGIVWRT